MPAPTDPPHPDAPTFPTSIQGPAGHLEIAVRLGRQDAEAGSPPAVALLAHPHPLYGGDMDNSVVRRTEARLFHRGTNTVRFNFRGVGRSDGRHDGGSGEVADLAAVFGWCREQFGGAPVLLVGYSFGAATILRSDPLDGVSGLLLIAPPFSFYDLSNAPMVDAAPVALVYGSEDELTAAPHRGQTGSWQVRTEEILAGVGHDLGAAGSRGQRARFDRAVDRCLESVAS